MESFFVLAQPGLSAVLVVKLASGGAGGDYVGGETFRNSGGGKWRARSGTRNKSRDQQFLFLFHHSCGAVAAAGKLGTKPDPSSKSSSLPVKVQRVG